jgi:signal transduction histidine kinase
MAERQRLAARIHDDVLQQLGRLRGRLTELAGGDLALNAVAEGIARQEAALRGLARPDPPAPPAGRVSLRDRMDSLTAQREDLPIRLTASGPAWLPDDVAGDVEAAVRELLTNVAKHARARRVWLTVLEEAGHVAVSVRDDGVGFAPGRDAGERLGLRLSVRARVERFDGEVRIRSRPGRGTEVELRIPVREG